MTMIKDGSNQYQLMSRNQGFTLIEVLVVMTITVMVSAAFFWNWSMRDRQQALSSAQTVAAVLREARDKGTYYGLPVNFTLNQKSCSYTVTTNPPTSVTKDFPLLVSKVRIGNDTSDFLPTTVITVTLPPFGSLTNSYEFFFVKGNYEVSVRLNKYAALVQVIKPN